MASSLVKDDPGFAETGRLWREVRAWLDRAHPDAVLLSEWGDPAVAVPAGFHADFFLHFGGPTNGRALRSLWSNGISTERPEWADDPCFFDADGRGSARRVPDRLPRRAHRDRRARAHRAAHRQPRLRPAARRTAHPRAVAARLRVPAHLPDPAGHLLRRRDRHALRSRPAGHRGQRHALRLQPRRVTHPHAMGLKPQRRIFRRPGRAASTCRSIPTRTAPPSPGSAPTRTRCCTPSGT